MSKRLQRDIENIRKHLASGNRDSAQRIVDFLLRSAPTERAKQQIINAVKEI